MEVMWQIGMSFALGSEVPRKVEYMFTLVDPDLSFDKSWKLWITVLIIIIATQKCSEY